MSNSTKKEKTKKILSEPKEQQKPRNNQTPENVNKDKDRVSEKSNLVEDPGPEFYKNLKRETGEILKITEDSNAKYSKRTIKSNWEKYEAPIDTYDEREEIENQGANFEELVNAAISSGGHFQFKQEKSWNNEIKPSHYDKYFDIDMSKLAVSLSNIPFHERNGLDPKLFTDSDILSMNHRSKKFRQKCEKSTSESYDDPNGKLFHILKENLAVNEKEPEKIKSSSLENTDFVRSLAEKVTLDASPSNFETLERINVDNRKSSEIKSNKKPDICGDSSEKEEDLEEWLDDLLSAP